MTKDELHAKLLLLWSRTIDDHKLSWEEWMKNAAYTRYVGQTTE